MNSTDLRRRLLRIRAVRAAANVRELRRLQADLTSSMLFDKEFYERQRQRKFPTNAIAVLDYLRKGSQSGLLGGPLLLPQVPRSGLDPGLWATAQWARTIRMHGFPRRTAHPAFDEAWYTAEHPAAASHPGGPLAHYLTTGLANNFRTNSSQADGVDLIALAEAALKGSQWQPSERSEVAASVLVPFPARPGGRGNLVRKLIGLASSRTETIVIPSDHSTPEIAVTLAAFSTLPGVVVAPPTGGNQCDRLRAGWALSRGETIVVVLSDCDFESGLIASLVESVRPLTLCQPPILASDGSLHALGRQLDGSRLLNALPLADAVRSGDSELAAVSGEVVAFLRADLVACGGFGNTNTSAEFGLDISRRFAERGGKALGITSYQACLNQESAEPVVIPVPGFVRSGRTRWAIKSAHPAGPRGRTWGDFHFAHALAAALERLGQEVAVDPLDSWYRPTNDLDDVVLVLRGLHRYSRGPERRTMLWVISHPELVSDDELRSADFSFAASTSWAAKASARGIQVEPLLQCTDRTMFHPDAGQPGTGWPVLFVGNTRGVQRPLVQLAAAIRTDLAIIGSGWDGQVSPELIKARYLDNEDLARTYRSAGVVLNDHWPDMAASGFLSNRLFDLTCAGARWISDPVPGLSEVFPTGRTAGTAAELELLLTDPSLLPDERDLLSAADQVAIQHSFDARAATLVEAYDRLR